MKELKPKTFLIYSHAVDEGHITENDDSMVTVPPTLSLLTKSLTSQLRQLIDPLSESSDGCGFDLYIQFLARNIS